MRICWIERMAAYGRAVLVWCYDFEWAKSRNLQVKASLHTPRVITCRPLLGTCYRISNVTHDKTRHNLYLMEI